MKENKLQGIICLCIMFVLCVGCSRNAGKKEAARETASPTGRVWESLDVDVKVCSMNQVNLSWNQIRDAGCYVIIREKLKSHDPVIPGVAVSKKELAALSSEHTSYQDITVKAGKYYRYHVYAYMGGKGQESGVPEEERGARLATYEEIVKAAVEDVYWETDDTENNAASPSSVMMTACFNRNDVTMAEPDGVEFYRGDSLSKMEMFADVPVSQEDLLNINGREGMRYVDENVEEGKSYYYWMQAYIEADGGREYGYASTYLRKSTIIPGGDYSMKFVQTKEGSSSVELSLKSNGKGNGELQFIGNQFNGLVDYVYQKKNGPYESLSMCLKEYRQGDGSWVSYQGQPLCLKGKGKIDLRLAPWEDGGTFLSPKDSWKSAEMVLMIEYDGIKRNLHFDLKGNRAFITEKQSEQDMTAVNSNEVMAYEVNHKEGCQNDSVPDAFFLYQGNLCDEDILIGSSTENCPDGVEIYRSSDNKNFSMAATVEYPEYGSVRYSDPVILAGEKYYYKARNYIDTDNGRIYGKYSECTGPLSGVCRGGKYKIWLAEGESAEKQNQVVVGFYSYSLANPTLHFDNTCASCQWGDEALSLVVMEYSLDGMHWKKNTGFSLSAKNMVYLKLKLETKQKEFDWEGVDWIYLEPFLKDHMDQSIGFTYDIGKDKTSYTLFSED